MDIVFPIISGIVIKLYDDIIDNNLIIDEIYMEVLKGLQWSTTAVLCMNDFNYALLFFIYMFTCDIGDTECLTTPYEKSGRIICLIILIMSFIFNYQSFEFIGIVSCIIFLYFIAVTYIDSKHESEEISIDKAYSRGTGTILISLLYIIGSRIGIHNSLLKLILMFAAYTGTSTLFQIYMISQQTPIEKA